MERSALQRSQVWQQPAVLSSHAAGTRDPTLGKMTIYSHLMVMARSKPKSVRIADLKARLSAYLRRVRSGETITVLDRDTPIARLVPLAGEAPLAVRPARGRLHDIRLPPPLALERDVVELLLEERQGER